MATEYSLWIQDDHHKTRDRFNPPSVVKGRRGAALRAHAIALVENQLANARPYGPAARARVELRDASGYLTIVARYVPQASTLVPGARQWLLEDPHPVEAAGFPVVVYCR